MARAVSRPGWMPPVVSNQALADVRNHYSRLVLHRPLCMTGKAVLLAGEYEGSPAVLKILTAGEARWRRRHDAEGRAYERFAADPPPVRTPRMLAPPARGLLLIEHLTGSPAAAQRYPDVIALPVVESVLACADALAAWPGGTRFAEDAGRPALTAADLAAAADIGVSGGALQAWAGDLTSIPQVFSHGDLLLTNALATGTEIALLDWEHAGLRPSGYDHALLWLTLMDHPAAQARVAAHAAGRAAFRFYICALLLREMRIHREAASVPQVARRYRALRRLADVVFAEFRTRVDH
ncbi:phosphotransferase [Frankia sp. R82]|uniref:phosphotransferase n=1 Tax=Frankia sp. R82 TaxID=2950553 RepID=UPI0020444D05|nr:phosphotransferase [Frankia sp. R82]MCM3883164.1 phosphotransferase [Frankia sp. R82]